MSDWFSEETEKSLKEVGFVRSANIGQYVEQNKAVSRVLLYKSKKYKYIIQLSTCLYGTNDNDKEIKDIYRKVREVSEVLKEE